MNSNFLFPKRIKWIGLFLIVAPISIVVILKLLNLEPNFHKKNFIQNNMTGLMCLGLFLMFFSRYSEDDEMLMQVRLNLTQFSLFFGVIYLILSPYGDYVFGNKIASEIGASQFLMTILIFQNILFQWKRYMLKKELNEE